MFASLILTMIADVTQHSQSSMLTISCNAFRTDPLIEQDFFTSWVS